MSKRTTDSVHFDQALVEVKTISHKKTVEWEALDRLLDGLIHEMATAGEKVSEQLIAVKTWDMRSTTMIEESIVVLVIFLCVFTSNMMYEVFEPIEWSLLEIVRGKADFVAVHKDACKLDPVRLGELHRRLSFVVIFYILLRIIFGSR